MKLIRNSLIVSLAALTLAIAGAQAPASAETSTVKVGHHNQLLMEKQIIAKLDLTSTQKEQVAASMKTAIESMKELRKSEKGSTDTADVKKEKHKAIMKTYADSLKTILTPTQLIKYKEMRKEIRKKEKEAKAEALKTVKAP